MRSLSEEMMCAFMNSRATLTATSNHLSSSVKPCRINAHEDWPEVSHISQVCVFQPRTAPLLAFPWRYQRILESCPAHDHAGSAGVSPLCL